MLLSSDPMLRKKRIASEPRLSVDPGPCGPDRKVLATASVRKVRKRFSDESDAQTKAWSKPPASGRLCSEVRTLLDRVPGLLDFRGDVCWRLAARQIDHAGPECTSADLAGHQV